MKIILFLAFILITQGANAQSVTEKETVGQGGFNMGKFKSAPKRVYINSFNVYFQVFASASASTQGGESFGRLRGNTNVAMGVSIDGVDTDDFMELANNAYQHYVSRLKAQGFEIVSADEAGKTDVLNDWVRKEGGQLSSAQAIGYVRAVPSGYTYFVRSESKSGKEKGTGAGAGGKGGIGSNTGMLSKALNDAIISDVTLTFNFVEMSVFRSDMLNISQVKGKPDFHFGTMHAGQTMLPAHVNFSFGKKLTAPEASIMTGLKGKFYSNEPVFNKDEKLKETAIAKSKFIPNYATVVFVENTNLSPSHILTCNTELYKKEAGRIMKEFLDVGLNRLEEKSK